METIQIKFFPFDGINSNVKEFEKQVNTWLREYHKQNVECIQWIPETKVLMIIYITHNADDLFKKKKDEKKSYHINGSDFELYEL